MITTSIVIVVIMITILNNQSHSQRTYSTFFTYRAYDKNDYDLCSPAATLSWPRLLVQLHVIT